MTEKKTTPRIMFADDFDECAEAADLTKPEKAAKPELRVAEQEGLFSGISGMLDGTIISRPRSKGRVPLERAPNAVIFIESPKYLDGPTLHYPQFEVVRDFFELLCPVCNDIERIRSVKDVPREEQILFQYNMCPKCGMDKLKNGPAFNGFNELVGVVGMRGGKSVLVACMSACIVHDLLCVDNLQEKLGLVKAQEIDGAFVAASGEQASETIYGHFRGFYDNSPWFQNYRKALMNLELSDPNYKRGELYWQTDSYIHFRDKHIRIKSLTSNSSSIAGKTRIFAVIDELARMDAGESKRSATEVYRVLKVSLMTIKAAVDRLRRQGIFGVPDATMFCISSPMYDDDKSMQLLRQAEKSKKMFAFHRATWEFNPDITQEDLADEYALDPIGAERDYGANPPGAENPFVRNKDIIEICIDKDRKSIVIVKDEMFTETIGEYKFNYIKPVITDLFYRNLNEYVIHCDPGQNNDSFCMAIGHKDKENIVYIDGALECRPIPKNNKFNMEPREVYFPAMPELVLEMARKLSLKYISYDRWNSTDHIHRLRERKIVAFQKNISRDDHIAFLNAMTAGTVRFPNRESEALDPATTRNIPCAKALWELRRLNDNGVKVDHLPGKTNDMIQCYIGVYRLLAHPEAVISVPEMVAGQRKERQGQYASSGRKLGSVIRMKPKGFGGPR
jgi:hypothetical protein